MATELNVPISLSPTDPRKTQLTERELDQIQKHVESGDLLGLPTETVYGLAARTTDAESLKAVFRLKNRPFYDPLIVHCSNLEQMKRLTSFDLNLIRSLTSAFWPGPLTLVVPSTDLIHPLINNGLGTVGLRVPSHPIARQIIDRIGPLAAPSANQFGRTSPTTAEHVEQSFSGHAEANRLLIVDGGPSEIGLESTVVRLEKSSTALTATVLRAGAITQSQLRTVMTGIPLQVELNSKAKANKDLHAPGRLDTHYQPRTPLVTLQSEATSLDAIDHRALASQLHTQATERLRSEPGSESTDQALCLQLATHLQNESCVRISLSADGQVAARELYALLRTADQSAKQMIVVTLPPRSLIRDEIWDAIFDRLTRARLGHVNLTNDLSSP